jgi:hypothetical protein
MFRVSDWGDSRPDSARLEFMLTRASDQKNLSSSGWREEERFLPPLQAEEQGHDLLLQVGPEVVDNLDLREVYRFYLNWPGLGQPLRAVFQVSDLLYSPLSEAGGIKLSAPAPDPPPAPPQEADKITGRPAAAGEEEEKNREALPGAESLPLAAEEPEQQLAPPLPPTPGEPKKKYVPPALVVAAEARKKLFSPKSWPYGVLIALVLLGLGILVKVYLLDNPETQIPPMQQAYQQLSRENPEPAASLELALKLRRLGSPEAYDAAFLLLEYAAAKDNAPAMLLLGEYYDPLNTDPNGSIIKDREQALAWYGRAARGGQEKAQARIEALNKETGEALESP